MPQKSKLIILGSLAITAFLVWLAVYIQEEQNFLKVYFFDVGQGDAILIQKNSQQILIDGGPNKAILQKLGQAMPFWDKNIELVISTHPDYDHLAGLNYVLERYKVNLILETSILCQTQACQKYQSFDKLRKIAEIGQQIKLGQNWLINILSVKESIVAKMLYQDKSFLFTGDAGFVIEKELINNNFNLKSDILKVGHHGSKNATSQEFLEQVNPEIAVISVGKNNQYNHPAPETLERLKDIQVLRTDEIGDIIIK
ncbi:MAG: MBL fold metallo-hydrolase [bacterium]